MNPNGSNYKNSRIDPEMNRMIVAILKEKVEYLENMRLNAEIFPEMVGTDIHSYEALNIAVRDTVIENAIERVKDCINYVNSISKT